VECEKSKEGRGFGRIEGGLKTEEKRYGGGGNRGQNAYKALKPWTSGSEKMGEKGTVDREQLGVK
jgi:hypothetical protein